MSFYDGKIEPLPAPTKTLTEQIVHIQNDIDGVFDEVVKLKKKLEIATKALERIYKPAVGYIYNFETDELDHTKLQDIAYKAIEEMEGVK